MQYSQLDKQFKLITVEGGEQGHHSDTVWNARNHLEVCWAWQSAGELGSSVISHRGGFACAFALWSIGHSKNVGCIVSYMYWTQTSTPKYTRTHHNRYNVTVLKVLRHICLCNIASVEYSFIDECNNRDKGFDNVLFPWVHLEWN